MVKIWFLKIDNGVLEDNIGEIVTFKILPLTFKIFLFLNLDYQLLENKK